MLVYLVGQDVHTAIGTSLAVVGGIAAEGMVEQRDTVRWKAGLLLGLRGIAGSVPGSLLSPYVSSSILLLLFSVLAIVASISMLLSRSTDASRDKTAPLWIVITAGIGIGIGFLTGFLGAGVGFLIVPTRKLKNAEQRLMPKNRRLEPAKLGVLRQRPRRGSLTRGNAGGFLTRRVFGTETKLAG